MRQGSNVRRGRGRPNRKQHIPLKSQTFDSAGPDVRVRGNAHQVFERYISMARDATASGDRVSAENFYQHAEHYYRILSETTDPQPNGQGGPNRHRGNGRAPNEERGPAPNQEAAAGGEASENKPRAEGPEAAVKASAPPSGEDGGPKSEPQAS